MKITVHANDFCPDDCPFCEPEERLIYGECSKVKEWVCENKDKCRYAVSLRKKDK